MLIDVSHPDAIYLRAALDDERAERIARQRGGGARIDDEPQTANPHPDGWLHAAWNDGWYAQDAVEEVERLKTQPHDDDCACPPCCEVTALADEVRRLKGDVEQLRTGCGVTGSWCEACDHVWPAVYGGECPWCAAERALGRLIAEREDPWTPETT